MTDDWSWLWHTPYLHMYVKLLEMSHADIYVNIIWHKLMYTWFKTCYEEIKWIQIMQIPHTHISTISSTLDLYIMTSGWLLVHFVHLMNQWKNTQNKQKLNKQTVISLNYRPLFPLTLSPDDNITVRLDFWVATVFCVFGVWQLTRFIMEQENDSVLCFQSHSRTKDEFTLICIIQYHS